MPKRVPTVPVELYIGECDNTWYTHTIDVDARLKSEEMEKQALKMFEADLACIGHRFGDVAFYGIYSLPSEDDITEALDPGGSA